MREIDEKQVLNNEGHQPSRQKDNTIQLKRVHPPFSVVITGVLYCAEFVSAAVLCSVYKETEDRFWLGLTLTFALVPSVITQLGLIFIHRDLGKDRPLVLFLHLLLLGPVVRCTEALIIYLRAGRREEPYVTISRKIRLRKGGGTAVEREIGHTERKLAAHRDAFKRVAVIQAFLGSTPQLTLQLYVSVQERSLLPARTTLIVISLLSIVYGALVCSVLAIQIKYDDYKVRMRPSAYLCAALWRGLEIATRTTALVLFSTELTYWVMPVVLGNLFFFFFLPWAELWRKGAPLPESLARGIGKAGTVVALCLVALLYACINVFCYSAVQLDLANRDLVERQPGWASLTAYYGTRLVENTALVATWYALRSDFYEYVCAPLLATQLGVGYALAVLFMMVFHQYCHPCRRLFTHNVADCLHCVCCQARPHHSAVPSIPDPTRLGDCAIFDDITETL